MAGSAGLAAAVRLRDLRPAGTEITVYEQSGVLGGKLRTGELAGSPVEFGAESFLMRDPAGAESAAVALARRLGLGDALVHPTVGQAALVVDGALRPVPGGTLVGVPGDLDAGDGGRAAGRGRRPRRRAAAARARARTSRSARWSGPASATRWCDRLVDPMLGGVYAGRADDLSLVATMPALARTARVEHTLAGAVRAAQAAAPRAARRPGLRHPRRWAQPGWSRPPRTASGATIRRDAAVRELTRHPATAGG